MYGETCFSQIFFTNKWVFSHEPESKRQFMEGKHADSPVKKKFWTQRSVKKVTLKVFWNMKGPIIIDEEVQL